MMICTLLVGGYDVSVAFENAQPQSAWWEPSRYEDNDDSAQVAKELESQLKRGGWNVKVSSPKYIPDGPGGGLGDYVVDIFQRPMLKNGLRL